MNRSVSRSLDAPAPPAYLQYLPALIALCGAALALIMFYPGLTSPDSDYQLSQARNFEFADGHPPIMALLWAVMIKFKDGPALMMVLFTAMYWGSFWLIARTLARRSAAAAGMVFVFAFSPLLLNFAGTIWKDVFVFDFFLLACALMYSHLESGHSMSRKVFGTVAALIIIGSLGRHNSIFSGLPLMVLAVYVHDRNAATSLGGFLRTFVKGGLLYVALLIPSYLLVQYIAHPTPMSVSSSLFVFDLIGMSLRANTYLLPSSPTFHLAQLQSCYDPAGWDKVWVSCPVLLDEMRANGSWAHLSGVWLDAVKAHPAEYLLHRLAHFRALFVPTWLVFLGDSTPLAAEFGFVKGSAFLLFERMMLALRTNPVLGILFTNGFWIVVNTVLMAVAAWRLLRAVNQRTVCAFLLIMSGFVYSAPFVLIGTAPDFRYVYWSIGAVLLSFAIALADRAPRRDATARRGASV